MAEPTLTADQTRILIDLAEEQEKVRKADLRNFAKDILDQKSTTNAAVNSSPRPPAATIETSFASTPMSPVAFAPPLGRKFTPVAQAAGAAGSGSANAFFSLYTQDGDLYLQCGTVTGGNGGEETISDLIVVADGSTLPLAESGDVLYLSCNVTATVTDEVLLPGLELNSATLTTTLPTAHTFTAASNTGTIFAEIGRWNDTTFLPAGPSGNRRATGCMADYYLTAV